MGHPRIFINLDKEGPHSCTYWYVLVRLDQVWGMRANVAGPFRCMCCRLRALFNLTVLPSSAVSAMRRTTTTTATDTLPAASTGLSPSDQGLV